jgi:heptosyltransferase-2
MTDTTLNKSKRILIVGPAWIGDMVMAQTLFKYLKSNDRQIIIDVLAPKWTLPLVERMPEVNAGIVFPLGHGELNLKTRYKIAKDLRKNHYDQSIVLTGSFKSALTPWWAKIPKRTGWLGEWRLGLLNDIRHINEQQQPLMIERFVALGLPKNQPMPNSLQHFYPHLTTDSEFANTILVKLGLNTAKPVLALCPGAEFGPAKRWLPEHFAQVAQQKIAQGWQVWIFGSAKESELAGLINSQTDNACIDLCGKTSLSEAVELLALSKIVISNDSGLMHIAAAVATPLIVLYGSSSPKFTPPLSKKVAIISEQLECSPCFKRTCPLEHFNCMKKITPETVLSKINTLLDYD